MAVQKKQTPPVLPRIEVAKTEVVEKAQAQPEKIEPTHLRLADGLTDSVMAKNAFTFRAGVPYELERFDEKFAKKLVSRRICILCNAEGIPA